MAETRLVDVVVPEVFNEYMTVDSPELSLFWDSSVVMRNAMLDAHANSGGNVAHIPFWRDLDADNEPNISIDDPAVDSTPDKITAGQQQALVAYLNQSWSAMDLAGELAGSDPVDRIIARVNAYWVRQWQRRLIASVVGVFEDNVANDDGDMVHDIATDAVGAPDPAELFGGAAAIAAEATLGDQIGEVSMIAMHSKVYSRARTLDLIEFVRESDNNTQFATYGGKPVLVDDGLPAVAGTERISYTTIFFGPGAFGYGEGAPKVPTEVDRNPEKGRGSGLEVLFNRRTWLLHPFGFFFDATFPAEPVGGATLAELRDAAPWSRVIDRKNVPLAFLRTNG